MKKILFFLIIFLKIASLYSAAAAPLSADSSLDAIKTLITKSLQQKNDPVEQVRQFLAKQEPQTLSLQKFLPVITFINKMNLSREKKDTIRQILEEHFTINDPKHIKIADENNEEALRRQYKLFPSDRSVYIKLLFFLLKTNNLEDAMTLIERPEKPITLIYKNILRLVDDNVQSNVPGFLRILLAIQKHFTLPHDYFFSSVTRAVLQAETSKLTPSDQQTAVASIERPTMPAATAASAVVVASVAPTLSVKPDDTTADKKYFQQLLRHIYNKEYSAVETMLQVASRPRVIPFCTLLQIKRMIPDVNVKDNLLPRIEASFAVNQHYNPWIPSTTYHQQTPFNSPTTSTLTTAATAVTAGASTESATTADEKYFQQLIALIYQDNYGEAMRLIEEPNRPKQIPANAIYQIKERIPHPLKDTYLTKIESNFTLPPWYKVWEIRKKTHPPQQAPSSLATPMPAAAASEPQLPFSYGQSMPITPQFYPYIYMPSQPIGMFMPPQPQYYSFT